MQKITKKNYLTYGYFLVALPIVFQLIPGVGSFILDNYGEGGENIVFYTALTMLIVGSLFCMLGFTFEWRKKTKSFVYKGSAILVGGSLLAATFIMAWFMATFVSGFSS